MELEQPNRVIDELLRQNAQLRFDIAVQHALLTSLSEELELLRQMQESQHIPPDLAEMLSKLDIR